jgi:hypothetical protein
MTLSNTSSTRNTLDSSQAQRDDSCEKNRSLEERRKITLRVMTPAEFQRRLEAAAKFMKNLR